MAKKHLKPTAKCLNLFLLVFSVTVSLLTFSCTSVFAQSTSSLTLAPIADANVRNGTYASTNYGSSTSLETKTYQGSTGFTRKAYLKFSLSGGTSKVETLEAENAILNKAVVASNNSGYTGTGFVDYINNTGDYVEWTINKNSAGMITLDFRYANGSTVNRPLQLLVNGVVISSSLGFAPTGSWTNWSTVSTTANLNNGVNKVRLTAIGSSGANIDHLKWTESTSGSEIPSNVVSAKLRVYGRNTENTATINISAFPVDVDSWNESTINFNTAPVAGTTALSTVPVNNVAQFYEFDVTNFFKTQLAGDKVLTVQLADQFNQNKIVAFNSKENVQNQPVLVVQTAMAGPASNTLMFVENLDRFPSNDRFVAARIQTPWTRDFVNYNANHDTVRIRIHNKGINPLVVSNLQLSNPSAWKFLKLKGVDYNAATALPFTVNSGSSADLTLQFIAVNQAARVKLLVDQMIITSNDDKEPFKTLHLHGLWQKQGEGSNEPTAQEVFNAFGFKTNVGFSGTDPDRGAPSKVKGDQILSSYFVKADPSRPVYVRQMGAYHNCCTNTELLRWYPKGQTGNADMRYFTGHIGLDGQSLLPRVSLPNTPAEARQNPTGAFGFRIGTLDWTDTLLNPGRKIGVRVWKALDAEGRVIPNAYIISNDYLGTEFTNYDYNDNTYFVSNIRPELGTVHYSTLSATPSAVDFGEKLLQSPNSFSLSVKNLGQTYSNGSADPVITISSVAIVGENRDEFSATLPANRNLDPQGTLSINVGFTPATEGLKTADLLIYYNNTTPLRVPLHGIGKANGTTVSVPFRIKSGSASNVVVGGKTWVSDVPYAFDNLEPYTNPQLTQISGTDEDVLYLREQSSNFDKRPFRYEMSIPNGQYWVRLHFAEIYWGTTAAPATAPTLGSRVMSVSIENELKVINLDVAQEVGTAAAYVRNIPVTVTDNKLNINFSATVNRPMVCAIEVYKFTTATPVTNATQAISDMSDASERPMIYPNPVKDKFQIEYSGAFERNINLEISDQLGRTYQIQTSAIREGSIIEVDISKFNFRPGIYYLRIYSNTRNTEVFKLLIE